MHKVIVIGGGISGLSTAYLIQQQALQENLPICVQLLEKESRVGGKIQSIQQAGYLCEWGANGFLSNKPQTLQLCQSLGISSQLLVSNDNARKRFVYANQQLHQLPHTPAEFLKNSLISWRGKLRILSEILIPAYTQSADESLASFTSRRLGPEALNKLITPMAAGIFAGDPAMMSVAACFPRIKQLEQEYGSLLRAMFCLSRQKRKDKNTTQISGSAAGPGGVLTSFSAGLQVLTDCLAEAIRRVNIVESAEVISLYSESNAYHVVTSDGVMLADSVICTAPAHAAAKIFAEFDFELAAGLSAINYAPLVVVCFGYARESIAQDVNGFGYLLASGESIPLLGSLWDSSIFASRAPDGKVLFRSMLGGARQPGLFNLTDSEIQQLVEDSLYQIMGIVAKPEMVQIFRHQQAIPQYQLGHLEHIARIAKLIKPYPGLYLSGNAYSGVGINDCVAAAYRVSSAAVAEIKTRLQ